jgi:hypothetical protein
MAWTAHFGSDYPKADLATPGCRAPQILEYLFGAGVGVA